MDNGLPLRQPSPPAASPIPEVEIRNQLEAILASAVFRGSPRAGRFLRFVVENTLEGRGDLLKEFLVGVEVFDRAPSFDPRADSVVRVEARRLRSKLRDYYDTEGRQDGVRIDLPKGGYMPLFSVGQPDHQAGGRARWLRWALGVVLLAALIAAFHFYLLWRKPPVTTIAVLQFENLTADPQNELFCYGLEDELATALAKVKGLRVAHSSGRRLRRGATLAEVSRQWKAGSVLEGSVRRSGDRVRVTLQLVRVSDHSNLWAETYERRGGDVLALHSEIARTVASSLAARLARPVLK